MVDMAAFEELMSRREAQLRRGWIGVDFDGTLAEYDHWMGWNVFGSPITRMISRVRRWLGEGHEVKVLTARIGARDGYYEGAQWHHSAARINECLITGAKFSNAMMAEAIGDWTETHVGARLEVTCIKDLRMIELWDDRVVQVEANTGRTVFDELEAEYYALRGKP
jgi:hypothetical protein